MCMHVLCIEYALLIGMAMVANRKVLLAMLVDCIPQFEAY